MGGILHSLGIRIAIAVINLITARISVSTVIANADSVFNWGKQ
jgi:hypothetical protein